MRKMLPVCVALAVLFAAGCKKNDGSSRAGEKTGVLRISYQNTLTHSPFFVMREMELLENKYAPNVTVEWSIISGANATAEALVGGHLDIAGMGAPQVLNLWDKGGEARILCGVSGNDTNRLEVLSPAIQSLRDFKPNDKIAMTSVSGTYAMLLAMACEREFGDAHALDSHLVAMAPDASVIALLNGNIAACFTGIPHMIQLEKAGAHPILPDAAQSANEDVSSALCVVTKKLYAEHPDMAAVFYAALCESIALINKRAPKAVEVIARDLNITENEALELLNVDGLNLTTTILGFDYYADFMYREGYISKKPALEDILWEPALAAIGKRSGEPGILEKAQKRGE